MTRLRLSDVSCVDEPFPSAIDAGDFVRHLSIASGSLHELETQLLVAVRVGYLKEAAVETALSRANEVGRMLAGLIRAVRRNRGL